MSTNRGAVNLLSAGPLLSVDYGRPAWLVRDFVTRGPVAASVFSVSAWTYNPPAPQNWQSGRALIFGPW